MIRENKKTRRVGEIYSRIASECFDNWYGDMPREERSAIFERRNFDEMENYVGAAGSIGTSIIALGNLLREYTGGKVCLPDDFHDIIFWSDTPNADLEQLEMEIRKVGLTEEAKAKIAARILDAIHWKWIEENEKKFSDPKRESKQYMFLPLELIGTDTAMLDFVFVGEILRVLGMRPERHVIEQRLAANRKYCAGYYELSDKDSLVGLIQGMGGRYPSIPASVTDTMKLLAVAERIADQVIAKCGLPSEW